MGETMAGGKLQRVMHQLRGLLGGGTGAAGSDRELLQRFAQGQDEAAFAALVERHGSMVNSVCRRILRDSHAADDAFQATFLVLARKAGTVRWQESIAGWLHAVAHRIAVKQRGQLSRRQARERQVDEMNSIPANDARPSALAPLLDDELARLPEKYRTPLVLCYLENRSGAETAALLGCTEGNLWTRLSRARDLLRQRLSRRGLNLASAALTAALANEAVAAPARPLRATTVQAACRLALGTAPAEVAPDTVINLMKGALHTMWIERVRFVALWAFIVLAASLGLGLWWHQGLGGLDDGAVAVPVPHENRRQPAADLQLKTVYLPTPIGRGHRFTLEGRLGGGARLIIDPNIERKSGKSKLISQVGYQTVDVELKEVVTFKDRLGRHLYELVGAPLPLCLVTPDREDGTYRLIQLKLAGQYDVVERVVTLEPAGPAVKKVGPRVAFSSAYLYDRFSTGAPNARSPVQVGINGELGGEATMKFDGNTCNLRACGDTNECTQRLDRPLKVTLRKINDEEYEVVGTPETTRLLLPGKQTRTGRLQLFDTDGVMMREVSLETP